MEKGLIYLFICIYVLTYPACSMMYGKVEQRNNTFFLVNKSKSERYRFTLKKTEIQDDSIYRYSTQLIELSPGDEKYLGEITAQSDISYPIVEKQVISIWKPKTKNEIKEIEEKIMKEREDGTLDRYVIAPSEISVPLDGSNGLDTVIKGEKLKYKYVTEKYYDKLHPIPIRHFKYRFEVTGEVLLKN